MKKNKSREKILKFDKNFTPLPVDESDEIFANGIFLFNITKMREFIHSHLDKFIPESIEVKYYPKEFSSINEKYMNSVQISKPVLLAEIAPGRYNLIDGNHRMEKARRMGIENIMAYRLNVKHHIKFITTQKAYIAYIEYWNDKLHEE
jgi:hypothetical protein